MEQVEKFIHWLNDIVWGPVMLVLLVGTGIWLTLILRGLQFGMLFYALKQAFRPHPKKDDGSDHEGDVSHFGALMTALSATIGTGNIAGVATAAGTGRGILDVDYRHFRHGHQIRRRRAGSEIPRYQQ